MGGPAPKFGVFAVNDCYPPDFLPPSYKSPLQPVVDLQTAFTGGNCRYGTEEVETASDLNADLINNVIEIDNKNNLELKIKCISIDGKIVKQHTGNEGHISIGTQDLAPGIYSLVVQGQETDLKKKICVIQ